jgi:hypothetical protein
MAIKNTKTTTQNNRMNMKETLIVNTNSEKQLNTGRKINYLVLMLTLVLCSPLQSIVPIISGANAATETSKAEAPEQKTFKTADAAVDTLIAALGKDDLDTLLDIFGREYKEQLIGGDPIASRENRKAAAKKAQECTSFVMMEKTGRYCTLATRPGRFLSHLLRKAKAGVLTRRPGLKKWSIVVSVKMN